ncbi:Inner membrane ABC transporter permease protein YtfT [compost metagenome]
MVIGGTSLNGGRFSITASLIGALIIQSINTGILVSGFPPEFNLIIKAGIIIVVLTLQSPAIATLVSFLRPAKPQQKPTASSVTREGSAQ